MCGKCGAMGYLLGLVDSESVISTLCHLIDNMYSHFV